jgi:hypothetical protein
LAKVFSEEISALNDDRLLCALNEKLKTPQILIFKRVTIGGSDHGAEVLFGDI